MSTEDLTTQIARAASERQTFVPLDCGDSTTLPGSVGDLQAARHMLITGKNLRQLPPEIGRLSNLETLRFEYTRLSSLPPEIGELENLRVLGLD